MHTDPIADMLNRIRNCKRNRNSEIHVPYSKVKHAILKVMQENKFIEHVEKKKMNEFEELHVVLGNRTHGITLKRISKPGQRIYIKASEIKPVLSGMGITILSTPKGVMSSREAKKQNLGGELLCELY